mmetsp:Transcript_69384/g.219560  ORF Transcript_69384/g.219560 Transcript_69384/m.219560 type:complete len:229 (+) Transcript_69384:734-1420(+)
MQSQAGGAPRLPAACRRTPWGRESTTRHCSAAAPASERAATNVILVGGGTACLFGEHEEDWWCTGPGRRALRRGGRRAARGVGGARGGSLWALARPPNRHKVLRPPLVATEQPRSIRRRGGALGVSVARWQRAPSRGRVGRARGAGGCGGTSVPPAPACPYLACLHDTRGGPFGRSGLSSGGVGRGATKPVRGSLVRIWPPTGEPRWAGFFRAGTGAVPAPSAAAVRG